MVMPRPDSLHVNQMMSHLEIMSTRHRILFLSGLIGGQTGFDDDPCNVIMGMASISKDPIKLFINSPGGSVAAMLSLYDTIKTLGVPVYTIGRFCASAAAVLLAAGEKRYVIPHGSVMLHMISGKIEGGYELLQTQSKELDRAMKIMVDLLQQCGVKKPTNQIMKDIRVDKWMSAQEAIDYGLADTVLDTVTMKDWMA